MALNLSLASNAVLVFALLLGWIRHLQIVRNEKLATFAGCIHAVAGGLGQEEPERRLERMALGLSSLRGKIQTESLRVLLGRVSVIRLFRGGVTLTDAGGEHVRLLAMSCVEGTKEADDVWRLINGSAESGGASPKRPREIFGDEVLAKAELQIEAQVLKMYRDALRA